MKASALFKTSPMYDSVEIVRVCLCRHLESQHADEDYDFNGARYVRDPRPCQVEGCTCEEFEL